MKAITKVVSAGLVVAAAVVVFAPSWTPVPPSAQEVGFPQEILFHSKAETSDYNKAPPVLPAAAEGGPSATQVYQNVQVLTDVSAAEFMRIQYALTAWVSPKQGCAFCHVGTNWASDAKPAKAASRVMLQMTRHLNTDWSSHVAPSGITCYSCHRGQPVPSATWFPDKPKPQHRMAEATENWQEIGDTVHKFFPDAGYAEYYLSNQPIRVQSETIEPNHSISSWPEAKNIYEMMMEMSDDIGANCGYCHNSRNWASWQQSSPYRWSGYDALRLVREVNNDFMLRIAEVEPLTRTLVGETTIPAMPVRMREAQPGNGLVACGTCHQGVTRPFNGVNMVDAYPGLGPLSPPGPIHGPGNIPSVVLPRADTPHAEIPASASPG